MAKKLKKLVKEPKPVCCDNCDGGLILEARDDGHWLVCEPCGVRVSGPYQSYHEVPNYKAVS